MSLKFHTLTRTKLKLLSPGEKLSEHGIVAERAIHGDIRWAINVMVDGQRIHRVIGRERDGVTRSDVEKAIEGLRTKAREGRLDLPVRRKNHPKFAEQAAAYMKRMEEIGGKNMKAKRQHIPTLLIPFFGAHRADRITVTLVQDYVKSRLSAGLRQATINRELATLSHCMRRMAKWGWIKPEHVPEIEKGAEARKPITVLSEADATKLMAAAVEDRDPRLWLFVAFGLNAAMRHSEILKVRYEHVDYEARRIFIPDAKAGEREQPITLALTDMIKRQEKKDGAAADWLFPSQSVRAKGPHRTNLSKQFLRAVIRAGLLPSKVTPHIMRHSAITNLVKAGVDIPTIQKISGHKTLAMVMRYVHVHGSHIDAGIAVINKAFPEGITR